MGLLGSIVGYVVMCEDLFYIIYLYSHLNNKTTLCLEWTANDKETMACLCFVWPYSGPYEFIYVYLQIVVQCCFKRYKSSRLVFCVCVCVRVGGGEGWGPAIATTIRVTLTLSNHPIAIQLSLSPAHSP